MEETKNCLKLPLRNEPVYRWNIKLQRVPLGWRNWLEVWREFTSLRLAADSDISASELSRASRSPFTRIRTLRWKNRPETLPSWQRVQRTVYSVHEEQGQKQFQRFHLTCAGVRQRTLLRVQVRGAVVRLETVYVWFTRLEGFIWAN